ncbi:MAG: hypothetical protein JXA96_17355 [Sedimentisphaerales bacterium]|nr:hypothetical protein [Sedimentisphaerales bacterium]
MAASANDIFWAYNWYIRHNPYKNIDNMTDDDLVRMRDLFVAANSELSTTASYSSAEFPGAITAAATTAAVNQATYPEKHKGA